MKKVIIGISIFIFNFHAFANGFESSGFRDMKWEEPISKYKDVMQLTSEENKLRKFYTKNNDEMSYGNIKLSSISYIFYRGKFSSVIFQTNKSTLYSKQLFNMFEKAFGKPAYSNKYTKKFQWKGASTNVSLKCYSSSHKCSVIFDSVAMSNIKMADGVKK